MSQEVNSVGPLPRVRRAGSIRRPDDRGGLPWRARAVRWAAAACRRLERMLSTGPSSDADEPDAAIGPILGKSDAPFLFEVLRGLARESGGGFPSEIRLSYLPACGVLDLSTSEGLHRHVLIVGLPCFQILSIDELSGVLAHELAHLTLEDAAFTQECMNFLTDWNRRMDLRRGWSRWLSPRWLAANGCAKGLLLAASPIARSMEFRADRWSAETVGGVHLARAIEKIALVQPIFREVLSTYDPLVRPAGNAYEFFERAWRRMPKAFLSALRRRLREEAATGRLDPHPAIGERLARLRSLPPAESRRPESALELLAAPAALKQLLHNRLFGSHDTPSSVFRRFDA